MPSAALPAMYDRRWQLGVPYDARYLASKAAAAFADLKITTSDADKLPLSAVDPRVTVFTRGAGEPRLDLPVVTGRAYADIAPIGDGAVAP